MADWFSSRHLIDLVLLATLLEIAALAIYRWRTGKGVRLAGIFANVLAGLCLMLAVRAALHAAPLGWIALALLGAGIAHAIDLRGRWER